MAAHFHAEGKTGLMRYARQFIMLAALVMGLLLLDGAEQSVWAAEPTAMESECGKHVGMTNRIAGCVRESIGNIADKFFDLDNGFYSVVSGFVAGFLTIGVAVYGIMAAAGMLEKVGRDTMVFLIKMSFIAYFTLNADVMYRYAIDGMDAAGEAVVQVTPKYGNADGDKDFSEILCLQAMKDAATVAGKPPVGPWIAMDCLIDTVFGIKMKPKMGDGGSTDLGDSADKWFNKNLEGEGLQRGLVFFFFSGMQTSVLGLMLAVLGFVFMWGLLAMIIKALLTYISGYIGVTFMMIISPLFIPLVLFRETKQYFDKWVKLTISFSLQPVLILLFISFSIAAVDLALFSGDYSVMYRIAGEASRKEGFTLNKYLTEKQAINPKPMVAFFAKTNEMVVETKESKGASLIPGLGFSECNEEGEKTMPECVGKMPIQAYRDTIDWKKVAEARDEVGPPVVLSDGATRKEQQISREVMAAVIFCGVVVFIMNRLMAVVPHILVDLIGDFGQSPNLFKGATEGWDKGAGQLSGQASGAVQSAIGSLANKTRGGAG